MRRLFVVTALVGGLLSLSMPTAWAASGNRAWAEGVRGVSSVRVAGSAAWQDLAGNQELTAGATLRTAPGAEALLSFPGDVVLRVAPGSQVEVSRMEGRHVGLRLQSGRLFASVPTLEEAPVQLEVETSSGQALSTGGEFTVEAGPETAVRVLAGSARLAGDQVAFDGAEGASAPSVEVPAGVRAVAANDQQVVHDENCPGHDPNCTGDPQHPGVHNENCPGHPANCPGHLPGAGGTGGTGGTGGAGGAGGVGGTVGGTGFPIFAVLGAAGLLGLVAALVSQASTAQSN